MKSLQDSKFTAAPWGLGNWTKSSSDWPLTSSDSFLLKLVLTVNRAAYSLMKDLTLFSNTQFIGLFQVYCQSLLCLKGSKWKSRIQIYISGHLRGGLPRSISCHFVMRVNSWQPVGVSYWEVSLSIRGDSLNLSRTGLVASQKNPLIMEEKWQKSVILLFPPQLPALNTSSLSFRRIPL